MKHVSIPALFALALCVSACGGPGGDPAPGPAAGAEPSLSREFAWSFGDWRTPIVPGRKSEYRRILIQPVPSLLVLERHGSQVGRSDDAEVPYPTICSFRYVSSRFSIEAGSRLPDGSTHTVVAEALAVEPLGFSGISPSCKAFIAREQAGLGVEPLRAGLALDSEGRLVQGGFQHERVK